MPIVHLLDQAGERRGVAPAVIASDRQSGVSALGAGFHRLATVGALGRSRLGRLVSFRLYRAAAAKCEPREKAAVPRKSAAVITLVEYTGANAAPLQAIWQDYEKIPLPDPAKPASADP